GRADSFVCIPLVPAPDPLPSLVVAHALRVPDLRDFIAWNAPAMREPERSFGSVNSAPGPLAIVRDQHQRCFSNSSARFQKAFDSVPPLRPRQQMLGIGGVRRARAGGSAPATQAFEEPHYIRLRSDSWCRCAPSTLHWT